MRRAASLLFLDLSTNVGWALGAWSSGAAPQAVGTWHLGTTSDLGLVYALFVQELADVIQANGEIGRIWVEAPIQSTPGTKAVSTIEMQFGLIALTRLIARRFDLPPVQSANVRTIRAKVLGKNPPKGEAKSECIAWCRAQGWRVEDDAQADAAIGWTWAGSYEARTEATIARG